MRILVINGSPRKGNTKVALDTICQGITQHMPGATIERLDAAKLNIKGCINCDKCQSNGGNCVLPDDTVATMNKITEADAIIFGSPVYWWDISAQLKLVIDKFYSRVETLQASPKKIGLICTGANELTDPQYRIIHEQFTCICNYLNWELAFHEAICAYTAKDLAKDTATLAKLENSWKFLQ